MGVVPSNMGGLGDHRFGDRDRRSDRPGELLSSASHRPVACLDEHRLGCAMENTASQFDLLGQLRSLIAQRNDAAEAFDVFKQDAVMAPADMVNGEASSEDAAEAAADEVDTFASQTEGLMASATDDELIAAYRQTGGEVGDLAAETLLDEIRRRDLEE